MYKSREEIMIAVLEAIDNILCADVDDNLCLAGIQGIITLYHALIHSTHDECGE